MPSGVSSAACAKAPEVAEVERREAVRPASLGAHAAIAASPGNRDQAVGVQAGRSQGWPKGVSQTPGASRRSTAPAPRGCALREEGGVA
jgi:hypothetical protein